MAIPNLLMPDWGNAGESIGNALMARTQRNRLAELLPGAMSGDETAQNRLLQVSPQHYQIAQNALRQQKADAVAADASRRSIIRQGLTDAAGTLVNLPDADQAAAWTGIRQGLVTQYPELASSLPEQYGPEVRATAMGLVGIKPQQPKAETDDIQEFRFAAQNGFGGTFDQWMARRSQSGSGASPYFQFLPGSDGYLVGNARTGQITPGVVNGQRAVPGALDPTLQGDLAGAKKAGTLAAERAAGRPKVESSLAAAEAKADNVIAEIDRILPSIGVTTAGPLGSTLSSIPGTPARDVQALIDTVKANLGFQELSEMRANSPTGGALGNVTEREIAYLQSVVANLEQEQSPTQLGENLKKVRTAVTGSKQRIRDAYTKEYNSENIPALLQQPESEAQSGVVDWNELP